jgi:hypothetical protein
MADNIKQHVAAPQFYIAFFNASGGQNVYVRIKGIDRIYLKSPASQGYEEDAFTVVTNGQRDTSCDETNKAIENWCAPHLARLGVGSRATDDQWRAIFFLTANLISRSRWARDNNVWQVQRARKLLPKAIKVLKELPPLPEGVRDLGLSADEVDDLPDVLARAADVQYPLIAALGTQAIAEELKTDKDCDLQVAPPGSTFITSDEPALILDSGKPVIMSLAEGFLARSEVEVYLPLKPELACLWSHKSSRATRTITAAEIAGYNRLIWENCYERAFASRKSDLEQL